MPLRIAARLSQQKRDIFSDVPFLLDNKIKARCSEGPKLWTRPGAAARV